MLAAVSGGVDSAVAAHLLKQAGHEVTAVTMQLMPCSETDEMRRNSCCSITGINAARRICDHLGIRHTVADMTEIFEQQIVGYFLKEYSLGRTPNPCVLCNRMVKFEALKTHAANLGCSLIATGHYARVETNVEGRHLLKCGADGNKDQSYFLWALSQEQLSSALFPVDDKTKDKVRAIAGDAGILDFVTPESQNICFVTKGSYHPFLRERLGCQLTPGPIRDTSGKVLGIHEGIELYTIGQRRGLGIAGGRPLYVVEIIPGENTVVLGSREDAMTRKFSAAGANWIAFAEPPAEFEAVVKIRYGHPGTKARVSVEEKSLTVEFEEPQFAVAPGQSAVFYDGDTVLGGATIGARL